MKKLKSKDKQIPSFSDIEFYDISLKLEDCHSLFVQLWNNSRPVFSEQIPTAAVIYNKEGNVLSFLLNYDFWQAQTFDQKVFVIAHECFHVALGHGIRFDNKHKTKDEIKIANIAMDVVINHRLLTTLGLERKDVDPKNKYCWIDTVFPPNTVDPDMNFEYYYLKMIENVKNADGQGGAKKDGNLLGGKNNNSGTNGSGDMSGTNETVDDHSGLNSISEKDYEKLMKEILDQMSKSEKVETKDLLNECAGQQAGGPTGRILQQLMNEVKVPKKLKWETIIQHWAKQSLKLTEQEEDTWIKPNRRFAMLDPKDMFLPGVVDVEKVTRENNKIDVWFFLDTSGSCAGLGPRFWQAANTLPEDRFDLKLFCFDTDVYPTTLASRRLYGFGGTSFTCIDRYIRYNSPIVNGQKKHPDAIFVLTDGFGDHVYPQIPENWYWFLTHDYRACIPSECNIFSLGDFE